MTILLIEDDKRLSDLICAAFPSDEVLTAASLAAATALLAVVKPVLMLVDLALPDSQGLDTLVALRSYKCPKVALTANQESLPTEAAKLGAIDYVKKTNGMGDVLARVRFNVEKVRPVQRFAPETFDKIKQCLARDRTMVS